MIVMMVNMINLMVRFFFMINLLKVFIILLVLCCNSISCDVLIVSDKWYNVVISNKDGNIDKLRGLLR